MRAFIDTSSLFKKYVDEHGSQELDELLQTVSEIVVSPVTWVELHAVVARRLREKLLTPQHAGWLTSELAKDFQHFHRVVWNDALEQRAVELVSRGSLATLDAIQLAAGLLSQAEVFVTSDHRLFNEARQHTAQARLI